MGIDLGNLAALRTFRVLRALKTVAIVPGEWKNTLCHQIHDIIINKMKITSYIELHHHTHKKTI